MRVWANSYGTIILFTRATTETTRNMAKASMSLPKASNSRATGITESGRAKVASPPSWA